jgi:hypothetical protein
MNYLFIKSGTTAKYKKESLYLDVGNNLCLGIIDHHHISNSQKSATRLVYENKNFISKDTNTIVLHQSPDLDCIASSFLASYYIKYNDFPQFTKELCNFLDKVDFGKPTNTIINLASCFSILKSQSKSDLDILKKGHKLINDYSSYNFDNGELPLQYTKFKKIINQDYFIYKKELKTFSILNFKLPLSSNKDILQETKCLLMDNPQAKLFKDWARLDGYDMLIVKWSKKRIVISIKNDSFLTLEGIGDKLNKIEQQKREELNIYINEPNRDGYNIPDPWYDGRAHNYTIIDSPRIGTFLNLDEILNILS